MYIFFFIINRSLKVHVNVTEQNKQVTKMLMASDNYTLITLNRTIMWKHNRTEPQPRRSVKKPVTVPRSLSNQSLLSLSLRSRSISLNSPFYTILEPPAGDKSPQLSAGKTSLRINLRRFSYLSRRNEYRRASQHPTWRASVPMYVSFSSNISFKITSFYELFIELSDSVRAPSQRP